MIKQCFKPIKKWTPRANDILLIVIIAVTVFLNILARCNSGFADWHVKYVFPIWVRVYGGFTSLFPFSVGECLIGVGIALTFLFLLSLIFLFIKPIRKLVRKYIRLYLNILVIVAFIMTENCFLLYQSSTFAEKYGVSNDCITAENLILMRNHIVHRVNEMSLKFDRDANGNIIYEGDYVKQAKTELKRLSKEYSQLDGFYVTPKWIYHSGFLSQQYILGYYFPFSMEANLNSYQYPPNIPTTMCHELAHTLGFILEDEANYIGFLACVDSDDEFFEYAAYLSVLYYVESAYQRIITGNEKQYETDEEISQLVWEDDIFLTEEAWEKVYEKSWFSTKMVDEATDVFLNMNLKANGVSDGTLSYSRVVQLLLTYYDGVLY